MNEEPPFLNLFVGNMMRAMGVVWIVLSGTCFIISFTFGIPFFFGPTLEASLLPLAKAVGIGAALWFVGGLIKGGEGR